MLNFDTLQIVDVVAIIAAMAAWRLADMHRQLAPTSDSAEILWRDRVVSILGFIAAAAGLLIRLYLARFSMTVHDMQAVYLDAGVAIGITIVAIFLALRVIRSFGSDMPESPLL